MSIDLRPARPDELAAAGALVAAAYVADGILGPEDDYLATLRDAVGRARDSEVLVAAPRAGGDLLGTVTWCPRGSSHREVATEAEGEFRSLGVAPAARGHGVGQALVLACVQRARAAGCLGVALSSEVSMVAAHRLYARLGFVREPGRDWSPVPEVRLVVYRLDLTDAAERTT